MTRGIKINDIMAKLLKLIAKSLKENLKRNAKKDEAIIESESANMRINTLYFLGRLFTVFSMLFVFLYLKRIIHKEFQI